MYGSRHMARLTRFSMPAIVEYIILLSDLDHRERMIAYYLPLLLCLTFYGRRMEGKTRSRGDELRSLALGNRIIRVTLLACMVSSNQPSTLSFVFFFCFFKISFFVACFSCLGDIF